MRESRKYFELKTPSHTENLEIIRHFVTSVARREGLSEEEIQDIELAVDEASSNVMKHAYGGQTDKEIHVAVRIDCQEFTVVITDQGRGFNPKSVKLPKMPEYFAKLRVGGLGIFLLKRLMDKVEYRRRPGSKNQVKMVKYVLRSNRGQGSRPI